MINEGNVTDVMLSISTQGYFPGEPLLVCPSSNSNTTKYEVLEGNRRLAALKLLLNPQLAPIKKETISQIAQEAEFKPERVPVVKYNNRDEVLLYLGYRHITGVDQWDSLAKARYLSQLRDKFNQYSYDEVLRKLAKLIGSRKDYVHKLLSGYRVFKNIESERFYNISNLNEENFEFSLLTTALSYTGIGDFVGVTNSKDEFTEAAIHKENLKDLSEWLFKESEGRTRIGESRNIRTLNEIVSSPKALEYFRNGKSLEEARLLTNEPNEIFRYSIQQAVKNLLNAKEQSHYAERPNSEDLESLREAVILARELHQLVNGKLNSMDLEF